LPSWTGSNEPSLSSPGYRGKRLGENRGRSIEQRYRASGLTLVTAAIALWNTVYIERAVQTSTNDGEALDPELFKYLSPLGWEHINLTGG